MNDRIEPNNIEEVRQALKYFNNRHYISLIAILS